MYNHSYHEDIDISAFSFLITGGAGFIGSNLVEYLIKHKAKKVRVLDNFSTGNRGNLNPYAEHPDFELIEGDIRDYNTCAMAVSKMDYVFHEAALGSVPRSIKDPITTNDVNISGFLNMLFACKEAKTKRFVYAASSSTYGDSTELPKVENKIGNPLSPYAVTKYVNELYSDVFSKLYGMKIIGLRYFNVFGQRQDPFGAYAAVIPKFVNQLMNYESPVINGDGEFSRDFTYIDNVIQANMRAMFTQNEQAVNQVYNVAFGEKTSLNELIELLKESLTEFDSGIEAVTIKYGPNRMGDIPHSLASIEKAKQLLNYHPRYSIREGLKEAVGWYVNDGIERLVK
ncbi:MAG: SDR family oxidoreductase [Flavitalea sp.]